jgi:hypothetical protein
MEDLDDHRLVLQEPVAPPATPSLRRGGLGTGHIEIDDNVPAVVLDPLHLDALQLPAKLIRPPSSTRPKLVGSVIS